MEQPQGCADSGTLDLCLLARRGPRRASGETGFGFVQIDAAHWPIWSPALGPLGPKTISGEEEPAKETGKARLRVCREPKEYGTESMEKGSVRGTHCHM